MVGVAVTPFRIQSGVCSSTAKLHLSLSETPEQSRHLVSLAQIHAVKLVGHSQCIEPTSQRIFWMLRSSDHEALGTTVREPRGRAGNRSGLAQEREDAGADHGADAE